MRRRRRRFHHSFSGVRQYGRLPEKLDADERHVLFLATTWLSRVLDHYPALGLEEVSIVTWVLGSSALDVLGASLLKLTPKADRAELEQELAECALDLEDFPRLVCHSLSQWPPQTISAMQREVSRALDRRLKALASTRHSSLARGIARFQHAFDLSDLERDLFTLIFLADQWSAIESYFDSHLSCSKVEGFKYLAAALGTTRAEIVRASQGTLVRSGLMENGYRGLAVSDDYTSNLQDPLRDMLPNGLYRKVPKETLGLDEHDLDPRVVEHARALLRADTRGPIHILLHGPAGAGKSTFARRLAHESGRPALEVPPDEDDRISARRLGLVACLRLKNQGNGVTALVDEADEMLETTSRSIFRRERRDKAWLNDALEQPGSRVIWVTNSIDQIDPSTQRRFAFSIKFRPLGPTQRARLWDRILRRRGLKRFFSAAEIEKLARRFKVSAGAIDLAVASTKELGLSGRKSIQDAVLRALEAHITLTSDTLPSHDKERVDDAYSIDGLNVEGDLELLLEQLEAFDRFLREGSSRRRRSINVLFAGPPGTGKSELARHIAERLGRELIVKRSSDLLDPFVGMTERRIAAAFEEAEREEAVLIIDEIDSLLFDRSAATRSWEVSHTNELLASMERFRGILIATTNRQDALDEASLRRFGEKLRFDFLTADGNEVFFERMLAPLVAGPPDHDSRRRLRAMTHLAPGDFKILRDRWSFSPQKPEMAQLLDGLDEEARLKRRRGKHRAVGF